MTASFALAALALALTTVSASRKPAPHPGPMFIDIGAGGSISLAGQRVSGTDVCRRANGHRVYVRGNQNLNYSDFSKAMAELQTCKNLPIALVGEERR